LSVPGKTFCSIGLILNRLKTEFDQRLREEQAGFELVGPVQNKY